MTRPAVSPADLARALVALRPGDDRTRAAVARVLGLGWAEPEGEESGGRGPRGGAGQAADSELRRPAPGPPRPPSGSERDDEVPPADEIGDEKATDEPIPTRLVRTRSISRRPPEWLEQAEPLARPGDVVATPPELPPLLRPGRERGILSVAARTGVSEGDLDLERVIAAVARAEPLRAVPRRSVPTLARGVQLLLDRSDAMLPFQGDLRHLERAVRNFVGDDALEILSFVACPGRRAGSGSIRRWRPYFPDCAAPRGSRVLAVTDLGIGMPATGPSTAAPGEWLEFARRLEAAETPLLVLTPYPRERWPPALALSLSILSLSRATSAGNAARAARDRVSRGTP